MINSERREEDEACLAKLLEYKDIFITLELCLVIGKSLQLSDDLLEKRLRNCTKKLKSRIKIEENAEILRIFSKKKRLLPHFENWLKTADEHHKSFDFYINELRLRLKRYK